MTRFTFRAGRWSTAAGLLASVGLLVGCGSSAASATKKPGPPATAPEIIPNQHGTNPDAFYVPNPIRVRVGQTITWKNLDNDLHDVTADSGLFQSPELAYHGTYRWTPTRPGRYTYFCTLHLEMHGVVIVSAH